MTSSVQVDLNIPWSPPLLTEEDKMVAIQVIRSGWITQGKETEKLEGELAGVCGAKHAIVVDHGTSALIAALLALEIGPGDEVLVPTLTFIASINAILAVGANPILVDCDPLTLNVTNELLEKKRTSKTKAILFVDVYGMPCDVDALTSYAQKHKLVLIEDAAQAIGAQYKKRPIGAFGHTAIMSFHMAKLVASGEGGCILTQDDALASRLRQIRNHGMEGRYNYVSFGLNFRITDIQSAMARVQLKKLSEVLAYRQTLVDHYKKGLRDLVEFQQIPDYVTTHPHMIFSIFFSNQKKRDSVQSFLRTNGIDTRICWVPCHDQPYHKNLFNSQGRFPNAEAVGEKGLSLPLGNALTVEEVKRVIDAVNDAIKKV